jgi:hypothetical protein
MTVYNFRQKPEGKRQFGRPWTRREVSKLLRPKTVVC